MNYTEISESVSETFDLLGWEWEDYGPPSQEDIAILLRELDERLESSGADVIELGRLAIRRGNEGEPNEVYVNFGDISES